jgi:hypothetical protein
MQLPVACSLTQEDLAGRRERWSRLAEQALRLHESTAGGARLRFRELPGVAAELDDLVAAECVCCAFADWSIEHASGELILTVSAAGEGAPAIRELFAALV